MQDEEKMNIVEVCGNLYIQSINLSLMTHIINKKGSAKDTEQGEKRRN